MRLLVRITKGVLVRISKILSKDNYGNLGKNLRKTPYGNRSKNM